MPIMAVAGVCPLVSSLRKWVIVMLWSGQSACMRSVQSVLRVGCHKKKRIPLPERANYTLSFNIVANEKRPLPQ